MLEKLGIIGWDKIEPTIIAALLAGEPLLFIGTHGVNKTEGAKILAQGVLGMDTNYVKYETPIIQTDDILGYINAKDMMEGKLSYLHTPASLWAADAVGLDELNRANPMTAAKLMETIRTKRIMGFETKIKLVFAMINPPRDYDTIYMDLALTSRFAVVKIPGTKEMSTKDLREIVRGCIPEPSKFAQFKTDFEAMKAITFDDKTLNEIANIAVKIGQKPDKDEKLEIAPRELQSIARLLTAAQKMKATGYSIDQGMMADMVLSKIPQVWGITRSQADYKTLRQNIITKLVGFAVNDPLSRAGSVDEVLSTPIKDKLQWSSTLVSVIQKESDADKLSSLLKQLTSMGVDRDTTNRCTHAAVVRLLQLSKLNDVPKDSLSWDRAEMMSWLKEILA